MKQVSVLLDSVERIRSFVDIIEKSEADADLSQGVNTWLEELDNV